MVNIPDFKPTCMAVDHFGNVLLCNAERDKDSRDVLRKVYVLRLDGKPITSFEVKSKGTIPAICTDRDGRIYVADDASPAGKIHVFAFGKPL